MSGAEQSKKVNIRQMCEFLGLNHITVYSRLADSYSLHDAFFLTAKEARLKARKVPLLTEAQKAERKKLSAKRYWERNKKALGEYLIKWRAANWERALEISRRSKVNNPGSRREEYGRRRAWKRDDKLSRGLVAKLLKLQRGLCPCCAQPLGDDFHLDHIVPLSKGGRHIDENIQLLRSKCNFSKNAKDPVDYMQSKGFLI